MLNPTTGVTLVEYNSAVLGGNSTHVRIVFPVQNITLTDDDISANGGIRITGMLNTDDDLTIGKAVAREISMHLINSDTFNGFDWTEEFHVDFGVDISGVTKWVTVGYFKGKKPTRLTRIPTIEFIAMDRMQRFDPVADEFLESISYPTTLGDIYHDLCSYVGISYTAGDELANAMNVSYTESPFNSGITYRALLAYIAEANCCYAVINASGNVQLKWFSDQTSNYSITGDDYFDLVIGEENAPVIDAIRIGSTDPEASGYIYPLNGYNTLYEIINNPLLLNLDATDKQSIINDMLTRFTAFGAYKPVAVSAVGNWMVEAGDIIEIGYDGNQTMDMPIFVREMQWNGGCNDAYECTGKAGRTEVSTDIAEQYKQDGKYYRIRSGVDISDDGVTVSGGKYVKIRSGGVFDVQSDNLEINSANGYIRTKEEESGYIKRVVLSELSSKVGNNIDASLNIRFDQSSPNLQLSFDDYATEENKTTHTVLKLWKQWFNDLTDILPCLMGDITVYNSQTHQYEVNSGLNIFAHFINAAHIEGECLANNLSTTEKYKALDARQGKALKDAIDAVNNKIKTPTVKSYSKAYSNLAAGDSQSFTASQMGFNAPSGKTAFALARINTGSNSVYVRGVNIGATGSTNAITIVNASDSPKSGTVTIDVTYL